MKNKPRGPYPLWEAEENHRHRWEQCSVHLPVIPVNVPHHTTSYTNWQPEPPLPLVTCSLATAIALSNRQVTWVGHTLTALTLPHPHLLLPLQTGLRSLEERIPHLGERFEGSTPPRPSHAHSHWVQMWLQAPYFLKFMTKIGHINPNLLLPVCALV